MENDVSYQCSTYQLGYLKKEEKGEYNRLM